MCDNGALRADQPDFILPRFGLLREPETFTKVLQNVRKLDARAYLKGGCLYTNWSSPRPSPDMSLLELLLVVPPIRPRSSRTVTNAIALLPVENELALPMTKAKEVGDPDSDSSCTSYLAPLNHSHVKGINMFNAPVVAPLNFLLSFAGLWIQQRAMSESRTAKERVDMERLRLQVAYSLEESEHRTEVSRHRFFEVLASQMGQEAVATLANKFMEITLADSVVANNNKIIKANTQRNKDYFSSIDISMRHWIIIFFVIVLFRLIMASEFAFYSAQANTNVARSAAAATGTAAEVLEAGEEVAKAGNEGAAGFIAIGRKICTLVCTWSPDSICRSNEFGSEGAQNQKLSKLFDDLFIIVGDLHIEVDELNRIIELRKMF